MKKYIHDFDIFNIKNSNENLYNDLKKGSISHWKRNVTGTYEEPVFIWVECLGHNHSIIKNSNISSSKVNKKLMQILGEKFDIKYPDMDTNKFDFSKFDKLSEFLTSIGLKKTTSKSNDGKKKYVFSGRLSMTNLKNL